MKWPWQKRDADEAPDTLREGQLSQDERWRIVSMRLDTIESLCATLCHALCENDGTLKAHLRSHAKDAERVPQGPGHLRVVPPTEGG